MKTSTARHATAGRASRGTCRSATLLLLLAAFVLAAPARAADTIGPIPRVLPPEGLEIPADIRSRLETRLAATKKRLEAVRDEALKPDVEVFTKAVELALLHREFYSPKDFAKADFALDEANKRLDLLAKGGSPWSKADGLVVRGYRSSIDGSAQPYGLVIPKNHDLSKPCPLYVWLHGRGDKNTDIHFLQERATRPGQITPPNAIVVHPFGRHCVGWKHAGEIDVLEVVESVKQRYRIDPDRIVLIGFSMGGAGAWHIGAHYADHWVAVSPGAGFVDVQRYQKITPDRLPEWYVQKLWGLYDVPDYVRNFFNTTVIAYSGELDKQRAAAEIMVSAFRDEGRELTHLIGPKVEHKYEPETLKGLLKRLDAIAAAGRKPYPTEVHLQTRTLRYPKEKWVRASGLAEHWKDSRIDAEKKDDSIMLQTSNVSRLTITLPPEWANSALMIDGQSLGRLMESPAAIQLTSLHPFGKQDGRWTRVEFDSLAEGATPTRADGLVTNAVLHKRPGLQGPIDDAFMSSFVVVTPSGKSKNRAFQAWCDAELAHFRSRWRALMRGELPTVQDSELLNSGLTEGNLVFWGDTDSNSALKTFLEDSPLRFQNRKWFVKGISYDGDRYVPSLVFPSRKGSDNWRYIVLNSGLTFREAHDRTNSQQNPKLPDWAIIDIRQPPDASAPGRIHDADFFDEQWQLKRQPKPATE